MADIIQSPPQAEALDVLGEIERQVLWLSTAIIDHANRVRPNPGGLKVGGHQASSASMVSIIANPARQAIGLPPNVLACIPGWNVAAMS